MSSIVTSIDIAAPLADAAVFFVPQRMPYWYGAEMAAEFQLLGGAADFQVSQKLQVAGKVGSRAVGHTAVITDYCWGKVLEWRFQDRYGVKGTERWELAPISSTNTRVTMISEYQMPNTLARFMDKLFTRRSIARRNKEYLARLKKLAERK
jgi:uncharacterized membrane protein